MGRLAEYQKKQLEQLMGAEAMGLKSANTPFYDVSVCRDFLCGTCPHDLFGNTRMDLGPCPKLHSNTLKISFRQALDDANVDYTGFFYEHDRKLREYVDANDREVRKLMKRLEMTVEESSKTKQLLDEMLEIDAAIKTTQMAVESLGEEGEVEKMQEEQAKWEALKGEKLEKEREINHLNESSGASGSQKLKVCETCSAYLSILDSDKRLADHYTGKLHMGFAQLRASLKEFDAQGGPVPLDARAGMGKPKFTGGAPPNGPSGNKREDHPSDAGQGRRDPPPRDSRDSGGRDRGDRERERERDRGDRRRRSRSRSPARRQ